MIMESHCDHDGRNKNDKSNAVTFEEAMDIVGTGYFQYKITAIGGLIILTSFLSANVIAFILPVAQCDLQMDSERKGRLVSAFFLGVSLTCHLWGFLSDTVGRKYILIRCLFIDGLLYLAIFLTPSFYVILFLRFINGITSCGGTVSVYAYVGEFQPAKFRSYSLMIASFIGSCAYVVSPCVAWLILPAQWQFQLYPGQLIRPWKLFFALCGIPSLASAIFLCFLPESPKFLLASGKKEKVTEILEKMYKQNHKKTDVFPVKSIKMNETEKVGRLEGNQNKVLAVFKLVWNQTAPLLKKPYRFNMILLLVSFFTTLYCNNGIYVWLPTAINNMKIYKNQTGKQEGTYCGVLQFHKENYKIDYNDNATNRTNEFFTNVRNISKDGFSVYQNSGMVKEEEMCDDTVDTSLYFIYLMLGIFLSISFIAVTILNKYANKKCIMIVLLLITMASEISMKMTHDLITVPIKACIALVVSGSLFPVLNSVVVELFPTNLRAMAGCLTLLTCRVGSITTHTVTGFLIEKHCEILLSVYIVFTAVNFLSVCFLPGKSSDVTVKSSQTKDINEEL